MINKLKIQGLRGFSKLTTIDFAIPDGQNIGSGLTIFVGPNNSGKTTIMEALRAFNFNSEHNRPTFVDTMRNNNVDSGKVFLELEYNSRDCISSENKHTMTIKSGEFDISSSDIKIDGIKFDFNNLWTLVEKNDLPSVFFLASRRNYQIYFQATGNSREEYILNQTLSSSIRVNSMGNFGARLSKLTTEQQVIFRNLVNQTLGYELDWNIGTDDNGQKYIGIREGKSVYKSDGWGDGIWSIFTICDSLYDSKPGGTIYIDEPELSLHPSLQKRVMELIKNYSIDRQIIINTHSPYFIDFSCLENGCKLYRTVKEQQNISVYGVNESSRKAISKEIEDFLQPHRWGLQSKEIFFLEDNIIITEGQEDVVCYNKILEELRNLDNLNSDNIFVQLKGNFFGWGAGGVGNIYKVAQILCSLGYKKVCAIFDGDRHEEYDKFRKDFSIIGYECYIIPENDVRDKPAQVAKTKKDGLCNSKGILKCEHIDAMRQMFEKINQYFSCK